MSADLSEQMSVLSSGKMAKPLDSIQAEHRKPKYPKSEVVATYKNRRTDVTRRTISRRSMTERQIAIVDILWLRTGKAAGQFDNGGVVRL